MKLSQAIVAMTLLLAGCDGSDGPEILDGPSIDVSPESLDFGELAAGTEASQDLTISNLGDMDLTLERVYLEGADLFTMDDTDVASILEPSESTSVTVTFTPVTDCLCQALMRIINDDEAVTVGLSGTGQAPVLQLEPQAMDLGDVEVGLDAQSELSIRNAGSLPLTVQEVSFDAETDELTAEGIPGKEVELDAADEIVVTVTYLPIDEGTDEAELQVLSDDPVTPQASATIQGTGVQAKKTE